MVRDSEEKDNVPGINEQTAVNTGCCQICAIATVDSRGQIVLPKELRGKADIKAGDKLAIISCESEGKVCCISLVKADDFTKTAKDMLGSMMKGILE
jgi:AbrB family looped-hinge helix DNA binding protein